MVSPEAVIAIKLTTNLATLACAGARLSIMYRKNRRSIHDTICHIFLFLGVFCDISATGCCVWVLLQERKAIQRLGSQRKADVTVDLPDNLKVLFVAHTLYYFAQCLIKAAYLVLYAQLFRLCDSKRRYVLHFAAIIWAICFILALSIMFLWCDPVSGNWYPNPSNPRCPMALNVQAFTALAVLNVMSDLAIVSVPIFLVSLLQLRRPERIALLFVFSIGSISIAASIVRVVVITGRLKADRLDWDTIHVYMLWTHAEVFFGVVAFMMPSFRFLLRKFKFMRRLSSSSSKNSHGVNRRSAFGIPTIRSTPQSPRERTPSVATIGSPPRSPRDRNGSIPWTISESLEPPEPKEFARSTDETCSERERNGSYPWTIDGSLEPLQEVREVANAREETNAPEEMDSSREKALPIWGLQ